MARTKTTETSSITAAQLADGDLIPVIDVSDTTMSSTGTNKKLAKSQLAEAAGVTAHLALGTDAHDASAISFSATGNLSSTDVQAAIAELDSEKAAVAEPIAAAHIADTSDAHDASAISVLDTAGNYTATDVEAVLAELPSRYAPLVDNKAQRPAQIKVMASPPTIGSLATSTAIASPQYKRTAGQASGAKIDTSWFTTQVGSSWSLAGSGYPDNLFISQATTTSSGGSSFGRVEFMHDGTALEIIAKGNGAFAQVFVDGELMSATPTTFTNDGNIYFLPITFSAQGVRRITVEFSSTFRLGGVVLGATDSVWSAGNNRPNVLLFSDSFGEGTGSSYSVDGFVPRLGNHLGWNIWANGQGGSGYVNAGSYTGKFSTRISLYSSLSFDAVVVAGGINDVSGVASIDTETATLFASIRSTWPNAKLIATSPPINKGVEGWPTAYYTIRDSIKTAVLAAGGVFIDIMEMPFGSSAAASSTLAASASASATSFSSNMIVPVGSTIEIGTGTANRERRRVTSVSGGGPYTLGCVALTNAHSSGETVTQVGPSLWTGTGKVGSTTGVGNCDVYVSSDGTHPTARGHAAIAQTLAEMILLQL